MFYLLTVGIEECRNKYFTQILNSHFHAYYISTILNTKQGCARVASAHACLMPSGLENCHSIVNVKHGCAHVARAHAKLDA